MEHLYDWLSISLPFGVKKRQGALNMASIFISPWKLVNVKSTPLGSLLGN
jgi:hypothetical protein